MKYLAPALLVLGFALAPPAAAQLIGGGPKQDLKDVWKPAATPKGGTS